jgi:death-on-curing protein
MTEPIWLEKTAVIVLHDRSLALHGGPSGIRDEGLLDSALDRPRNRHHYEGTEDLAALAATYAVAISSNHPFVDGNKRAAFMAALLFLRVNGKRITASQVDATRVMFEVAAGKFDIDALADWITANIRDA